MKREICIRMIFKSLNCWGLWVITHCPKGMKDTKLMKGSWKIQRKWWMSSKMEEVRTVALSRDKQLPWKDWRLWKWVDLNLLSSLGARSATKGKRVSYHLELNKVWGKSSELMKFYLRMISQVWISKRKRNSRGRSWRLRRCSIVPKLINLMVKVLMEFKLW